MGLHTGIGTLGGDDYVSVDVNRAARIAALAHGGQVLVSDATRVLVEGALPNGVSLRSLGEFELKDLTRHERLHQLVDRGRALRLPAAAPDRSTHRQSPKGDLELRRAGAGARRPCLARDRATAGHADRSRRHGQDPAGHRGGAPNGRPVRARHVAGDARCDQRPRAGHGGDRVELLAGGIPGNDAIRPARRLPGRSRDAARPGQLRAGHRCGAEPHGAARGRAAAAHPGDEPRPAAPLAGAGVSRRAAQRARDGRPAGRCPRERVGSPVRRASGSRPPRVHVVARGRARPLPRSAGASTACPSGSSSRRRGSGCSRPRRSPNG